MAQIRQVYVLYPFLSFGILLLQYRKHLYLILLLNPHVSCDLTNTLFLCLPQKWKYYLNKGSEINISYSLSSESSTIYLVIAEGILSTWDFSGFSFHLMSICFSCNYIHLSLSVRLYPRLTSMILNEFDFIKLIWLNWIWSEVIHVWMFPI